MNQNAHVYAINSPFMPFAKIDQNLNIQKRNTFSGENQLCSEKSAFKPYKKPEAVGGQRIGISPNSALKHCAASAYDNEQTAVSTVFN